MTTGSSPRQHSGSNDRYANFWTWKFLMTAYMTSASCREIHFTMVTPYWIARQKYQQIHKYKTTDLLRSRQSWWNMRATVKFCWTSAHHWVRTVPQQQNATEFSSAIHKHTVQQQQTVQPLLHNSLKRTITWESIKCQYPSRHLKCNNFHVPTLHNEAYILTTALLNKSATVLRSENHTKHTEVRFCRPYQI